ncbi:isocitrate dehydrogenase [NADP] [Olea europaea subsp. europaea]|uniref:Isocitrate dehydrogenase [NADP] n=1 Tax=Olea europaea subsp. europaea TaxID=158383 RepID=A0A8S0R479_OLEEU|nr:isocitrate dehydrogenase [NADP] [Olea europaea subsp. europaea]
MRVMTRKNLDDPGEPPGILLSAATSLWMPVAHRRLVSAILMNTVLPEAPMFKPEFCPQVPEPENGERPMEVLDVYDFKGPVVALAMYNVHQSIQAFAESSMAMAFAKNGVFS